LGILGIELPTRRRNRVNGPVVNIDRVGFSIAVEQSFGNCPQYIQRRDYVAAGGRAEFEARLLPLSEVVGTGTWREAEAAFSTGGWG
jgi:hypothetical protein